MRIIKFYKENKGIFFNIDKQITLSLKSSLCKKTRRKRPITKFIPYFSPALFTLYYVKIINPRATRLSNFALFKEETAYNLSIWEYALNAMSLLSLISAPKRP